VAWESQGRKSSIEPIVFRASFFLFFDGWDERRGKLLIKREEKLDPLPIVLERFLPVTAIHRPVERMVRLQQGDRRHKWIVKIRQRVPRLEKRPPCIY